MRLEKATVWHWPPAVRVFVKVLGRRGDAAPRGPRAPVGADPPAEAPILDHAYTAAPTCEPLAPRHLGRLFLHSTWHSRSPESRPGIKAEGQVQVLSEGRERRTPSRVGILLSALNPTSPQMGSRRWSSAVSKSLRPSSPCSKPQVRPGSEATWEWL